MHITVAWEINAAGTKWTAVNDAMKAVIKAYSWARPLKETYIIKVSSNEERLKIADGLTAVAKSADVKVNHIVSPLMEGGTYQGWLPKDMWNSINERTK